MLGIVAGVAVISTGDPSDADAVATQRLRAQLLFACAGAASAAASALAISSSSTEADADAAAVGYPTAETEIRDQGGIVSVQEVSPEAISGGVESLLADIEAAQETQRRLIRGIGHDLRSPLASVVSMAESLQNGELGSLTTQQSDACGMLAGTARRLMGQTEVLYALSEGRTQAAGEEVQDFDASEVVRDVVGGMMPWAAAKGVALSVRGADSPLEVTLDRIAFERIVANLTDNAVKFTDAGDVSVVLRASAERLRFEVTDTGIGIDAEDLKRITEHYYRGDHVLDRQGTGVGLAVVEELARAMGGSLEIESQLGTGSRFIVDLPTRLEPVAQ